MSMMGELARSDDYDPNAVDWSRMNQPFGTLTDPNPVQYSAAGGMVQIRPSDIDTATNVALGASGGGLATKPIRAYHGSPHDFDRFDLSKIGTGEGAQAYGHGLYFAENEGVARGYRDQLKGKTDPRAPEEIIADNFLNIHGDRAKAIQQIERVMQSRRLPTGSPNRDMEKAIGLLESNQPLATHQGRMYEVNINADPAHFLDWDKKLSQHAPEAQRAIKSAIPNDDFGRMFQSGGNDPYGWRVNQFMADAYGKGNQSAADMARGAAALREAGVPGIKYLDQGSRGLSTIYNVGSPAKEFGPYTPFTTQADAEAHLAMLRRQGFPDAEIKTQAQPQSSNYVVFNDKLIDILRKYGLAGAAPAGMGALAAQDQYQGE